MLEGGTEYQKGKTPFARKGGKSLLAKEIISLFPDVKAYDTYVEPFVGAGNIFFRTVKEPGITEVLNDKDKRVTIVFKELKTNSKELNNKIKRGIISREYFEHNKGSLKPNNIIEVFKSSMFSTGENYAQSAGTRPIKTDYSVFFQDRLKDVIITNQDFNKVIKDYDSKRTFFYLDPPYESIKQVDYPDYCTPEDVYKSIKSIKGLFALSYNDSPNIRSIFKEFNIKTLQTSYNTEQGPKKVSEVFITNY